ncbi:hypothetical protein JCM6882_003562 [Rhodosporidiobolus microsporus]
MPSQTSGGKSVGGKGKGSGGREHPIRDSASSPRARFDAPSHRQFPVARVRKYLKRGHYAQRVGKASAVYLAAVLEYLVAEVLELAGNAARDNKKKRIIPRHLQLAIRNDDELNRLLASVTLSQGGVLPHIHHELLPQKTPKSPSKKKKASTADDDE